MSQRQRTREEIAQDLAREANAILIEIEALDKDWKLEPPILVDGNPYSTTMVIASVARHYIELDLKALSHNGPRHQNIKITLEREERLVSQLRFELARMKALVLEGTSRT